MHHFFKKHYRFSFFKIASETFWLAHISEYCYNFSMVLNTDQKCVKIVPMAYLILAIIGSFAFSTSEFFRIDASCKDILGSKSYFSSITHAVDWLAEDTPIISKAYKTSNSPLRHGLLRYFTLTGITGIAIFPVIPNFKINKNDSFPVIKKLIPLKLRI